MPTPVYSSRLLAGLGLSGTLTFTCPTGFVVVLVALDTWYVGIPAASSHLLGHLGQTIWGNAYPGAASPTYASWRGRQLIKGGETCKITTSQAMDVTLFGYELTTP